MDHTVTVVNPTTQLPVRYDEGYILNAPIKSLYTPNTNTVPIYFSQHNYHCGGYPLGGCPPLAGRPPLLGVYDLSSCVYDRSGAYPLLGVYDRS